MFRFLSALPRDGLLVFFTRVVRMFAFGALGMVLALYFHKLGFTDQQIGLLLTSTMLSDALFSLVVVTYADRLGRSRVLALGAWMMVLSGCLLGAARGPHLSLIFAATILGIVPPSEYEFGPFSILEQSILTGLISPKERTQVFAWYEMCGFLASALGSLTAGQVIEQLQARCHLAPLDSYRAITVLYSVLGALIAVCFHSLSPAAEVASEIAVGAHTPLLEHASSPQEDGGLKEIADPAEEPLPAGGWSVLGLRGESLRRAAILSGLSTLDAFAGAFITGSMLAYWFRVRFGVDAGVLGGIFSVAMFLAGMSFLVAPIFAKRIGLVNTMVCTHLPGNIVIILVPLMPNLPSATAMLFVRYAIAQMHIPARQSYIASIVRPEERTVTLGITDTVRHVGASVPPYIAGWLKAQGHFGVIFFCCGFFKILYDVLLLWSFRHIKPPEEQHDEHVRVADSTVEQPRIA